MLTLVSRLSTSLSGHVDLPGDKSISHRSLILGTIARGQTRIRGLLEGADVLSTRDALIGLGGQISKDDASGEWVVEGMGLGSFVEPEQPLDLGNSGTGARLLMGAVAGSSVAAVFTGDASLSVRPMARVTRPLELMGAGITAREGTYLPLTVTGAMPPRSIDWQSPHASAQVKSAILLAGLTARGTTTVTEPQASRDHTESMLRHFGVAVDSNPLDDGGLRVALTGEVDLTAADIAVPADPSSAAFLAVAALITEGADITLRNVGTNPLRFGLFETLLEMGADITMENPRTEGGEPVADLRVRSSRLNGVDVPPSRAASMIDEYPILSVAAATASGKTTMRGVGELRVKETDRIALMANGLREMGISVEDDETSMTVTGQGELGGGITVDACHDHRIAMSFLTLGLASAAPMTVIGAETIATSFPGFVETMQSIGGQIAEPDQC
ncbi:MAG: 3-phosphoshikimate 1-carboxyvinyltransferase [Candidatus Puniceispirillales bacterium]